MFLYANVIASADAALWVTGAATLATTVVLLGSAVFALWQLREATKTRYAQMIVEMTERWGESELRAARAALSTLLADDVEQLIHRLYQHTASPEDRELYYQLIPLPTFIEVIGIIVVRVEALTVEQVDDLWGGMILASWAKWEKAIEIMLEQANSEHAFENYRELVRRIRIHRHGWSALSPASYFGVMAPPPV